MRLIVLSAFMIPALCAQPLPDAASLLKQKDEAAKTHRSMQYAAEITMEMSRAGQPMKMAGEASMAFQQPGKMRMDTKMQGVGITIVSDGENTWGYNSMTKQYTKQAAAPGPEGILAAMGMKDLPDMSKAPQTTKVLRDETIEMDGQKHDCWVVETRIDKWKMAIMGQDVELSNAVMTYWLDKKLAIDLQMTASMSMNMPAMGGSMDMQQKVVKKSLKFDEPIPDSFFAFTPPADAKLVDSLMGIPKTDLSGKDAAAFEVKSLDGKAYSLAALKGKPVLLDFWATWCSPCRKSMPVLEKINREYGDQGLVILAVNAGEERASVEEFLKKMPMPYPVVLGGESEIQAAYQVSAFPTFVMIGRDGKIAAYEIGYGGEDVLRGMLGKAGLTAPAPAAKPK